MGFDCLSLPPMARLAYELNAGAVRARREREAALAAGKRPSPDQWRAWALAETGDGRLADEQAAQWAAACMRADAGAEIDAGA